MRKLPIVRSCRVDLKENTNMQKLTHFVTGWDGHVQTKITCRCAQALACAGHD